MMQKLVLPAIALLHFYLESYFALYLSAEQIGYEWTLVPRFLLLFLLFMSAYYKLETAFVYAFIFGALYDIVYTEIIGVYLVLFPMSIWIASKLMRWLQHHIVLLVLIALVAVSCLEWVLYGFQLLVNNTEIGVQTFVLERFVPSILLQLVWLVVFAFFYSKLLQKQRTIVLDA
ncbi:rod shape-determining protein MreD [Bacillus fonticola]|uniref:rod shape-determining protein MreD n=1 Tax=Bacillus fonticola TaxID=2728853 RepID=UPI001475FB8B|nr:rod shape-determining protein MreD [Bacillus fonticola]